MSHTRFRVNVHSVDVCMSSSSLLKSGATGNRKRTLNRLAPLETHN